MFPRIKSHHIEFIVHLLFWIFIFTAVNVEWSSNWFDKSIRPNTPAPLSILIFPIFFYVNAFILLPKFFSRESWTRYALFAILLFILPEILRILAYKAWFPNISFGKELFSRDSFLFGAPSPFFLALNASFIYRFARDRFKKRDKSQTLETATQQVSKEEAIPYENVSIISTEESEALQQALEKQLSQEQIHLNPNLTLRMLAEQLGSTEKKVSFLLNQEMHTNFYELINQHRIEHFKTEISKPQNQALSIMGVASNCGFSSKSSFYRAFKSAMGMSPSEYIKNKQERG